MKFPCDYIVHCEPIEKGTKVTMSGWEELIRCKDCAEWKVRCGGIKRNYCGKTGCIVGKYDFCSKAEPKETEK